MIAPTVGARRPLIAQIRGSLRLVRSGNLLILFATVLLGALLSAGPAAFQGEGLSTALMAALVAALIAGAANALNDALDEEADRINRPDRPVPSGLASARFARGTWMALSAIGLLLALTLSVVHVALAFICIALLYLYNVRLKHLPLLGNLVVALLGGTAIVFGALAHGMPPPVWAGAAFAVGTTLARELTKDVQDEWGDRQAGAETTAVAWGAHRTATMAATILAFTVLATPVPYLYMQYGGIYLLGVLVTDAMLLRAAWVLLQREPEYARRTSRIIKWGMVTGILSLGLYWLN